MSLSPSRPTRQRLLSGYSLMARGEPFVWLTGGMMVVCLAMLVLLLSIILYNGLATFWPREIRWIPLDNGAFVAGEWQYNESYRLNSDSTTDPPTLAQRQLLRIGNAEYFGKHFRLVNDQEQSGPAWLPPDYYAIERRKGGRYYALPIRLEEDAPIASDPTWLALQQLLQSFATPNRLLSEDAANSDLSLSNLDWALLINLQRQSLLESWSNSHADQSWVPLTSDTPDSKPESTPDPTSASPSTSQVTLSPSHLTSDPNSIRNTLPSWLQEAAQLQAECDDLQEQIAAADRAMNVARLRLKELELRLHANWSEPLEAAVSTLVQRLEQTHQLQASIDALDLVLQSKQLASDLETHRPSLTLLREAWQKEHKRLDSLPTSKDLEILQPVLQTHPFSQPSIDQYLATVVKQTRRQIPWRDALRRSEAKQADRRFIGAMPPANENSLKAIGEEAIPGENWSEQAAKVVTASLQTDPAIPSATDFVRIDYPQAPGCLVKVPDAKRGVVYHWLSRDSELRPRSLELTEHPLPVANIVRAYQANQLSFANKVSVFIGRWWEFVFANPREANTEGGVFPAIWGTIVMTLIMSLLVVPFGVMASLYLREYAQPGLMVSIIRVCVNNLAGVPSIVYGVFGLAFFCYTVGGFLDGGPERIEITPWPAAPWFALVGFLTVIGFAAFWISLQAGAFGPSAKSRNGWTKKLAAALWLTCSIGVLFLIIKSPFFEGFYRASLPAPTFGKGALLWAAFTLALLTLPVVIVATEEALSAVPNSLREGSYACGASKWQTIHRIVLPHARPGILTGSILAMARGAGEVAPLMLVGAIPSAIELPLDSEFPFFHGSRSFMHLGFQIYSLGFQSQNSDAARPMVFTTTLLLIIIVAMLNFIAIWLRARLRKSFAGSQF